MAGLVMLLLDVSGVVCVVDVVVGAAVPISVYFGLYNGCLVLFNSILVLYFC